VQIVIGDLGDPQIVAHAVQGTRIVFHVGASMRGWAEQFRAGTTVATQNIVEACLRFGIQRLVYVSSLGILDHAGRREGAVLNESSAYEPHPQRRGLYTQMKLEAEKIVLDAISTRGLRAVLVRPGQIFGPGAEHVPPNGVIALAGRWVLVGTGRLTLPLVYLDDVVDGLVLASERPDVEGRVFNLVDPAVVTQNTYLEACRQKFGIGLKIVRVRKGLMLFLAAGIELLSKLVRRDLPLSRYRVRSLRPLANFDRTAAQTALGWEPRVGAVEGMRRTFLTSH
jgi:nucleoside-diphosphate-sugar epimerase